MLVLKSVRKFLFFNLNFGPQHPAAHGVLRLILELSGEVVVRADAHIGLLHRGTEKLMELKSFFQGIPYFDRLDYVSMVCQEHAYALVLEDFLQLSVSTKVSFVRMLFSELTRILNHLLALTTHALDVGALTPFLWVFEDRERIMEFYERVSGARMHAAYFRPGGLSSLVSESLLCDILVFCFNFKCRVSELEELLTKSRVWRRRLVGVGTVGHSSAVSWGFSGVMARGSGVFWDVRKAMPYEQYSFVDFDVPVGVVGDCYDRFLLRVEEMRQSTKIIMQVVSILLKRCFASRFKNTVCLTDGGQSEMESVLGKFTFLSSGAGVGNLLSVFKYIESPKGEFGAFLVGDCFKSPLRCKIKSPGYAHLQGIDFMSRGLFLAGVVW
jgi:NADH:ubiquinone oxidoreductase subunit D